MKSSPEIVCPYCGLPKKNQREKTFGDYECGTHKYLYSCEQSYACREIVRLKERVRVLAVALSECQEELAQQRREMDEIICAEDNSITGGKGEG